MEQKATSQVSAVPQPFKLRVALRSASSTQWSSDDEDEEDTGTTDSREVKRPRKTSNTKKRRLKKFEDDETAVTQPTPSNERGSDFGEDVSDTFLAKRAQNIKDNKAMVTERHTAFVN